MNPGGPIKKLPEAMSAPFSVTFTPPMMPQASEPYA